MTHLNAASQLPATPRLAERPLAHRHLGRQGSALRILRPRVKLRKWDVLFEAGTSSPGLYRVEQGLVILTVEDWRGHQATLEIVGPGGVFGELSLVADGETTFGATALLPAKLTRVHHDPQDSAMLLPAVLAVLSARVRVQQDLVFRRQSSSLSQGLAQLLLDLSVVCPGSDRRLPDRLTQTDLARVLATSRESVSRILTGFARRGWVRTSPRLDLPTVPLALMQHADCGAAPTGRQRLLATSLERQSLLASLAGLPPTTPPAYGAGHRAQAVRQYG